VPHLMQITWATGSSDSFFDIQQLCKLVTLPTVRPLATAFTAGVTTLGIARANKEI
jgi:hypothetical protein